VRLSRCRLVALAGLCLLAGCVTTVQPGAELAGAHAGADSAPVQKLSLALGGDVMFGRATRDGWREHGGSEPFGAWTHALKTADISLVNLEMGVCEQGPSAGVLPRLWAPALSLRALTRAGIDAVSVANNHALDCGEDGLDRTLAALSKRGIAAVGVAPTGRVALGKEVLLLGATFEPPRRSSGAVPLVLRAPWAEARSIDDFITRVHQERARHVDVLLVVSLHWGLERVSEPAAWQADFARRLIDAGANVIAGHGSHTRQPREDYAGGVILYGLGNLVFDDRTRLGRPQPPVVINLQRDERGWRAVD
jgi:poly-gamma-glutamate capsule biosynthesis protein CapA/YwtB (metallophosphatase superfamily)